MNKRPTAVALATAALLLGAAAPAGAVPETELKPARLERGPDMAVAHLEGKTVVDGDVRIRIRAGSVRLLGSSGDDYVVGRANRTGDGSFRTLRVTPEGERTLLLRGVPIWELELSDDGTLLAAASTTRRGERTRLRVFDTTDGASVADRRFGGSLSVLDIDGGRLILGGWGPDRTLAWTPVGNVTERLLGRVGYRADIGADRVATFTRDPYQGGCTVVSTLAVPRERLWRSCDEAVYSLAPGGSRMATVHILSDGIGASDVWLRKAGGKALAHYTAAWFGQLWWESDTSLLLDTNGSTKSAVVRCRVTDCERASALRPRADFRVTTPGRP